MSGSFILSATAEKQELDWGTFTWISRPDLTGARSLAVCYVEIAPGKGHNFHRHPAQEEVIHVIEGRMEQWLGRERKVLGPRDSVFIPADTVHASFNTGRSLLRVIAMLGPCAGPEGYELVDVSGAEPWKGMRTGGN